MRRPGMASTADQTSDSLPIIARGEETSRPPGKNAMEAHDTLDFLHYGYLPKDLDPVAVQWWGDLERDERIHEASHEERVERGREALLAAFDDSSAPLHVVPLSGGLDSRAVLCALLERGLGDRTVAVTLGSRGSFDFEIGLEVARALGVRSEAIALDEIQIEREDLARAARGAGTPMWLFGRVFLDRIYRRFGTDAVYWSGFFGDPLAGSHLRAHDSSRWSDARAHFAERNRSVRTVRLTPEDYDATQCLPDRAPLEESPLSMDEQLDFLVRQESYIRPTVVPHGYDVRTPFLHPDWTRFALSLPRESRYGQIFYEQFLSSVFPRAFSWPTKNNLGLPLGAPKWRKAARRLRFGLASRVGRMLPALPTPADPRVNYFDWNRALLVREDLAELVEAATSSSGVRGVVPWLDPRGLWNEHRRRIAPRADALTALVCLDVCLDVFAQDSETAEEPVT